MEWNSSITLFHGMEPLKITTQRSNGTETDAYSCLDLATGE